MINSAKVINLEEYKGNGKVEEEFQIIPNKGGTDVEFHVPEGYNLKIELIEKMTIVNETSLEENVTNIEPQKIIRETNSLKTELFHEYEKNKENELGLITSWITEKGTYTNNYYSVLDSYKSLINSFEYNKWSDEKVLLLKRIYNRQIKFLSFSAVWSIVSLFLLSITLVTKNYFIHPFVFFISSLVGIGWGITAWLSMNNSQREFFDE